MKKKLTAKQRALLDGEIKATSGILRDLGEAERAHQAELDAIETADAQRLIADLQREFGVLFPTNNSEAQVAIVKRWLKKHWSDGWKAAGGPSGAPVPAAKKKKGRK